MIKGFISKMLHRREGAGGVQRLLSRPVRRGESTPGIFRGMALADIHQGQRRQLDRVCPLDYLSVETVRRCLQDCQLGAYAEQQWIWEQMEKYDAMLMTCITKRDDALAKYDWNITVKTGLNDRDGILAEAQKRTIVDLCNGIVNLGDAITALSQASRRHYRFLQPYADSKGLYLLPVDNWLMCRDGYWGAWGYNPSAQFGRYKGEELPVPLDELILRVHPRPIDLPAQMLVLNRSTTLAQWDVFLERLGTPPLFFKLPPDCSDDLRQLYIEAAGRFVSASTGVIDHGAEIQSVPVSGTSVEIFDRRYKVATEEIAMLTTAGKLTVMTESGSGTLAGGAQADGFADWAAGEAGDIAGVITAQLVNRVLDEYHPGQPHLVEFTLCSVERTEPDREIANAAALRAAGYELNEAEVSERTGWSVQAGGVPVGGAPYGGTPYMLNHRRQEVLRALALHRRTTLWEPARRRLEELAGQELKRIDRKLEEITEAELPLSEEEAGRLDQLLRPPSEEEINRAAWQIAQRLQDAREEGLRKAMGVDSTLIPISPAESLHGANLAHLDQ